MVDKKLPNGKLSVFNNFLLFLREKMDMQPKIFQIKSIKKSFIILAVLRLSMQRVCGTHLPVIAGRQHSFFRRNAAAVASCWQHYFRCDRPEI